MTTIQFPRPTIHTLLERVSRHYPGGLESDHPGYHDTTEAQRLRCVREAAARSCQWSFYDVPDKERLPLDCAIEPVLDALRAWRSMANHWSKEFPMFTLWDESNPWHDASYRYAALRLGYTRGADDWRDPVVLALSILAPVYVIYTYTPKPGKPTGVRYSDFPERYRDRIVALARYAGEMFGFHRLDEATIRAPAPDVTPFGSNKLIRETTLIDCLFTAVP